MDDLHKLAAKYFEKDRGVSLQVDEEEEDRSAKARREAGRYTLEEAAFFVKTHGRARARSILNGLMDAIAFRTLNIYEPGLNGKYITDVVRPWRDEVFWADLNDWLEKNEPLIGQIFPSPVGAQVVKKGRAVSSTTTESVTRVIRSRRNFLDPVIDKAIHRAGSKEFADVYLVLKEMALEGERHFKGTFNGSALCYTDINDKDNELSRNALGKRLAKRRLGRH